MDLLSCIDQINALNEEGVKLACGPSPDYDAALAKHHDAVILTKQQELNPDYRAFSVANEGYARRQKGEDRSAVLGLLENILGEMPSLMSGWKSNGCRESYAGKARLLEEIALVRRYTPDTDIVADLTQALSELREAISLYQQAFDNAAGAEILSPEKVQDRLWRTYGITSAVGTELFRNEPGRKREHLETANSYAQQELDARIAAGEKEGFPLMNAYHTLGVVQTELTGEDKIKYDAAKENLEMAMFLAEQAHLGLNISTLTFRKAWLEYRRDPTDISAITPLVQQVLDFQKVDTHRWNGGTMKALRQQMEELATHLGGQCQQEISTLYSPTPL